LLDFTALVRQRHPGAPVFWFGESLGALIAIDTAASPGECPSAVSGLILASPVVALHSHLRPPFFRNLLLRTLLRLRPGNRIPLEAIANSDVRVTSDTTHAQQMARTSHHVKDFTFRLFGQVEKLIRQSTAAARRIHPPVLVLYTPNDPLTPHAGVERFVENLASPDKSRAFFPESYHLILHDKNRADALQRMDAWLRQRSPGPKKH
jgi:alpha-beta hydrolase superfamily lysophospholipase